MPPSVFGFAWKYTKAQQIWILAVVLGSMPTYFMSLELPKLIVNGPIQGVGFEVPGATDTFLRIAPSVPEWIAGGGQLEIFSGLQLDRIGMLIALSLAFLSLVIVNGLFKFYINLYKGRLGERMLRRLRFELVDRVLRFPMAQFRRVKPAEVASMVKDEVEPVGGFIGEAFVTPVFLGGQALTAMAFILLQSMTLGIIAASIIAIQAVVIPRLRRRQVELGRQRQITARQLAGRVGELVDGVAAVHANDTSNYERAEVSARLGRIFSIRYELFMRKFLVKFLNNFLAQLTPFLFYSIGGWFALRGSIDIGQLVAVIAAYKDLPAPIKELIDWDLQRLDVQVKYSQVIEQFNADNMLDPSLQRLVSEPVPPLSGDIRLVNVSITDDAGTRLLEQVSARLELDRHTALVGGPDSGVEHLPDALARLLPASSGRITINDHAIDELEEAVTGRRISLVPADAPLMQGTVADNLLYGLKHAPLRPASYDDAGRSLRAWEESEARKTANAPFDVQADWIDYDSAGATGPEDMLDQIKHVLALVDLHEDLLNLGLRGTIDPVAQSDLADNILSARRAVRGKLAHEEYSGLVELFDPERYTSQATIAENLLFGTFGEQHLSADELAAHPYMRQLLAALDLDRTLFEMGREIAGTAIELFADLPPDHPFFEQLSFMTAEQIPDYQAALGRVHGHTYDTAGAEDRQRFIRLPFVYIEPRHRMGLIDQALQDKLLEARRRFHEERPSELAAVVELYDPGAYNRNASIQDNILLGRIAYGVAGGEEKVLGIIRSVLGELGLEDGVLRVGLDFIVGTGGKRLSHGQRQKVIFARALLRKPDVLIVNRALTALDRPSQNAITKRVLGALAGDGGRKTGIVWTTPVPAMALDFERVIVMDNGRVVEDGPPHELLKKDGFFARLVA
ncbi:MAG TPA: ABC transporter ATP-binding protein [Aestuariivirgaceae bacterium]|nr:ABC transporter ATP-binding protein [Aestuariivirgaceae bacterium]